MPPRPFVLHEANYWQLGEHHPSLAVLPWGATEAHNYHLPHGTDVIEARAVAERAAELAHQAGARVVVLPAVPFGNNLLKAKLGVRFAAYELRHAFATRKLKEGVDPITVAGLLGHKDATMLCKHYEGIMGDGQHLINAVNGGPAT